MSFSIVTSIVGIGVCVVRLREIEKAQPRNLEQFVKSFLNVLAFQLSKLVSGHLTPVGGERAIHFAANRKHRVFVGVSGKRSAQLFLEHGEAAFEILKVERRRRLEQRARLVKALRSFVETR